MKEETTFKKYILTLERYPQKDFIKREGLGLNQEDAVKTMLDKFFAENKTQKVKLASCIEIIS